jgi:DNA methylase
MTLRIVEIHRVLKPTGSFYLHCDPTASHYLKLILDAVFCGQGGDYLNEILWCYKSGGASKSWYARKHDTLFLYCKGKNYTFNPQKEKSYMKPSSGKNPAQTYHKDQDGSYTLVYTKDWWSDIGMLSTDAKERLGYPTQKPETLLERIISTSSNEGDTVLDAYCGCGTTVAVAQRLGRRWIGTDITYQSISLILKRLADKYPADWQTIEANILLDGVPRDLASAVALANRKDDKTRKEFEKWAVLTYSNNQARINEKKGADAGIDGIAYFLKDKNENGKAIFQVKSGTSNRATLATLNSDRLQAGADFGILIAMDLPTKAMREVIAAAGKYKHPLLNREDDRLQVITVAEILQGNRLNLPMARPDAVKSAEAVGDADRQGDLPI